jgi:hypothetical protein
MARLGWNAFNAAHARPYIVFADFDASGSRQTRFAMLARLANGMNPKGDYALLPEDNFIRVVFQQESDAVAFAGGVMARKTAREGGWAGQWWFDFDAETEAVIRTALPEKKPRAASRRRQ